MELPQNLGHKAKCILMVFVIACVGAGPVSGQFGGAGGMGGAGAGGSGGAPGPAERPKFRDHIHSLDALPLGQETGETVVTDVVIQGNKSVGEHAISQKLQTKKGRFYSRETLLGDVRRLNEMKVFDHVTFREKEGPQGVAVTFIVHERPLVTEVIYHGARGMGERELAGRAGIAVGDPLSEFSIESARRRMMDFYREKGFNQVAITTSIGFGDVPGRVVFRINEGPLERIKSIEVIGNTILSEARLKKIIKSRGPFMRLGLWTFNRANLAQIDQDKDLLASHYHNLGYLTATVGRQISYDKDGKFMHVKYVINEGQRFQIKNIQIVGNQFVTEDSLSQRLELKPGDMFDGTVLKRDVGELVYGYGELGFIYADVQPQTIMREEENMVDLVYKIEEGDRWKIGEIRVNIEGEPHLMRETVMLNLLDLHEGDFIDRRLLEVARRRMARGQLLETNPQIADPPDIIVEPKEDAY
ncbi:outer membrane protein assembly factor [Roseiconus sp. JC912]